MNDDDLRKILLVISQKLKEKDFIWRIDGNANLRLQGVIVSVRDLDISTTDVGITIFREALQEYIVKDFVSQKSKSSCLICDINGFEVEINSYNNAELNMFDKTKKIFWNDMQIRILPLKQAHKFYQLINRPEKVDLIATYLS